MKKVIALVIIAGFYLPSIGQDIRISGDTVYYEQQKIYVGKEIKLGYGSGTDGKFVFIKYGDVMKAIRPAPSIYSKQKVVVTKVYKNSNGYMAVTTMPPSMGDVDDKMYIDIEGSIDKGELMK